MPVVPGEKLRVHGVHLRLDGFAFELGAAIGDESQQAPGGAVGDGVIRDGVEDHGLAVVEGFDIAERDVAVLYAPVGAELGGRGRRIGIGRLVR